MIQERTHKILLAFACCLVLILLPLTAGAQIKQGIEKGAKGVGKGVEYGVDKTKEGAKAVGHEVKKPFTHDDDNTDVDRQKPADTDSQATQDTTRSKETTTTTTREKQSTNASDAGDKNLPRTAGEVPLLGLLGTLALTGFAASRISGRIRRARSR